MEEIFRVRLNDGYVKDFTDKNKVLELQAQVDKEKAEDLAKQKREQEEHAKAVAKAEAERKAKEEAKEYRYNQVLDKLDSLNKVVESYEKEAGVKLKYVTVNGKLEVREETKANGFPYLDIDNAHIWFNDLIEELKSNKVHVFYV